MNKLRKDEEILNELNELELRISKLNAKRNAQMEEIKNYQPLRRRAYDDYILSNPYLRNQYLRRYPLTHWRSLSHLNSYYPYDYYGLSYPYDVSGYYPETRNIVRRLKRLVSQQEKEMADDYIDSSKSKFRSELDLYKPKSNYDRIGYLKDAQFLKPTNKNDNFYKRYNNFLSRVLKPLYRPQRSHVSNLYEKYKTPLKNYDHYRRLWNPYYDSLDSTMFLKPWYHYRSPYFYRNQLYPSISKLYDEQDSEPISKVYPLKIPTDVASILRDSALKNKYSTSHESLLKSDKYDSKPYTHAKPRFPSWKQYYYTQKLRSESGNKDYFEYDPYLDFLSDSASLADEAGGNVVRKWNSEESLLHKSAPKEDCLYRELAYKNIIYNLKNKLAKSYIENQILNEINSVSSSPHPSVTEMLPKFRNYEDYRAKIGNQDPQIDSMQSYQKGLNMDHLNMYNEHDTMYRRPHNIVKPSVNLSDKPYENYQNLSDKAYKPIDLNAAQELQSHSEKPNASYGNEMNNPIYQVQDRYSKQQTAKDNVYKPLNGIYTTPDTYLRPEEISYQKFETCEPLNLHQRTAPKTYQKLQEKNAIHEPLSTNQGSSTTYSRDIHPKPIEQANGIRESRKYLDIDSKPEYQQASGDTYSPKTSQPEEFAYKKPGMNLDIDNYKVSIPHNDNRKTKPEEYSYERPSVNTNRDNYPENYKLSNNDNRKAIPEESYERPSVNTNRDNYPENYKLSNNRKAIPEEYSYERPNVNTNRDNYPENYKLSTSHNDNRKPIPEEYSYERPIVNTNRDKYHRDPYQNIGANKSTMPVEYTFERPTANINSDNYQPTDRQPKLDGNKPSKPGEYINERHSETNRNNYQSRDSYPKPPENSSDEHTRERPSINTHVDNQPREPYQSPHANKTTKPEEYTFGSQSVNTNKDNYQPRDRYITTDTKGENPEEYISDRPSMYTDMDNYQLINSSQNPLDNKTSEPERYNYERPNAIMRQDSYQLRDTYGKPNDNTNHAAYTHEQSSVNTNKDNYQSTDSIQKQDVSKIPNPKEYVHRSSYETPYEPDFTQETIGDTMQPNNVHKPILDTHIMPGEVTHTLHEVQQTNSGSKVEKNKTQTTADLPEFKPPPKTLSRRPSVQHIKPGVSLSRKNSLQTIPIVDSRGRRLSRTHGISDDTIVENKDTNKEQTNQSPSSVRPLAFNMENAKRTTEQQSAETKPGTGETYAQPGDGHLQTLHEQKVMDIQPVSFVEQSQANQPYQPQAQDNMYTNYYDNNRLNYNPNYYNDQSNINENEGLVPVYTKEEKDYYEQPRSSYEQGHAFQPTPAEELNPESNQQYQQNYVEQASDYKSTDEQYQNPQNFDYHNPNTSEYFQSSADYYTNNPNEIPYEPSYPEYQNLVSSRKGSSVEYTPTSGDYNRGIFARSSTTVDVDEPSEMTPNYPKDMDSETRDTFETNQVYNRKSFDHETDKVPENIASRKNSGVDEVLSAGSVSGGHIPDKEETKTTDSIEQEPTEKPDKVLRKSISEDKKFIKPNLEKRKSIQGVAPAVERTKPRLKSAENKLKRVASTIKSKQLAKK